MSCLTRFLLPITVASVAAVHSAADAPSEASVELYVRGMKAFEGQAPYETPDYIDALKYLFAYQTVMSEELESDPEGAQKLRIAIEFCEETLRKMTPVTGENECVVIDPDGAVTKIDLGEGGFAVTSGGIMVPLHPEMENLVTFPIEPQPAVPEPTLGPQTLKSDSGFAGRGSSAGGGTGGGFGALPRRGRPKGISFDLEEIILRDPKDLYHGRFKK